MFHFIVTSNIEDTDIDDRIVGYREYDMVMTKILGLKTDGRLPVYSLHMN